MRKALRVFLCQAWSSKVVSVSLYPTSTRVLEVVEPGATCYLKSGHGTDIPVQEHLGEVVSAWGW